ncbi:MAG: hypothetical protein KJ601_02780 [Nanoarchaeota archaeon]|nr:hypothetical protein [Nanoarchaeota archaeon]
MKEKTLKKLAFSIAFIGIIVLYLISSNIDYTITSIDKITKENVGEKVKVRGMVSQVYGDNTTIIKIEQPSTLDVVVFDKIDIKEGDYIEVIGDVEEYNDGVEVIAKRVRVIG